jgi:hypothetical protein
MIFCGLLEHEDSKLFEVMQRDDHCVHHLRSPVETQRNNLRPRGHSYELPKCQYDVIKHGDFSRPPFGRGLNLPADL